MKKSYIVQCPPFTDREVRFFKPVSKCPNLKTLHQITRGSRQENTFRKKKISTCHQLNYSSRMNPLAKGHARFDKPLVEFDRKKVVGLASFSMSDPLTLRYEGPPKQPRYKPQFTNSFSYQVDVERKYLLPSDRSSSPNKKRYYTQIGFSSSLEKLPRSRDSQNSSNIRPILEYRQADHLMGRVTGKIGHE